MIKNIKLRFKYAAANQNKSA